jgi:hypothetical protein
MKSKSLLLRHVHPNFYPNKELSSQAFFPFPKDKGKLSVYDGKLVTPAQSFEHFTQLHKLKSVGVWGVNDEEIIETGLISCSDPLLDSPAHAFVDFSSASEKEWRKLSKKLKAFAVTRGCLYSPK